MTEKPKGFKARLKHAFALEKADELTIDEKTAAVIDKVCREVVRREMVVPAHMLLEMSRPLNYLGSQALHFFQPFGSVLVDPDAWARFAAFLEQRGSVEYLVNRLDELSKESESPSEQPSKGVTAEGKPDSDDSEVEKRVESDSDGG